MKRRKSLNKYATGENEEKPAEKPNEKVKAASTSNSKKVAQVLAIGAMLSAMANYNDKGV